MALYHDHIPKLSDTEVVGYNQEEDMIEFGATAEQLVSALEDRFHDEVVDLLEAEHCTFDCAE